MATDTSKHYLNAKVLKGSTGSVCGGPEPSLHFMTAQEQREYRADLMEFFMQQYHKLAQRYGIWSGNQDGYVQCVEDMSPHSYRGDWDRYQAWLAQRTSNPTERR